METALARHWARAIGLVVLVGVLSISLSAASLTPRRAQVATLTYVALGASDAFGIGTQDPRTQSWPAVLAQTLGPDYHLINLGVPGATVLVAAHAELPVALAQQPALITVWLAVNDLEANVPLATYIDQLRSLLLALSSLAGARIYVGDLPDLTLLPSFAHADQVALTATITQWNGAIAALCQNLGVTLVDLYAPWSDLRSHPTKIAQDFSADGFHPSAAGAQQLAATFAAAIATSKSSVAP